MQHHSSVLLSTTKSKNPVKIGDQFGLVKIIGQPFGIRLDRGKRTTWCVTECTKCSEISVKYLNSIKQESSKGRACCANCYYKRSFPDKKEYPKPNTKIGAYTILGVPFYTRTDSGRKKVTVVVECNCGRVYALDFYELMRERDGYKKLGCISCTAPKNLKHKQIPLNRSKNPIYYRWQRLLYRCDHQELYVRHNIKVCDEWLIFENFEKWFYENGFQPHANIPYGDRLSIDRIDPRLGYAPSNCRLVSLRQNAQNVSKGRDDIIHRLEKRCQYLSDLLDQNGIEYKNEQDIGG